jgi:proline iminopeptidase
MMGEALLTMSDGARIWTHRSGRGVPTVLLNGGPGMADYLGPVAELLGDVCAALRFEARGCGRSAPHGPYRLRRFVADVDELRARTGVDRWLVIGHSWGVDLALAYALTHPRRLLGLVGIAGGRVMDDRAWSAVYHAGRHREAPAPAAAPPNVQVNRALNQDWRTFCRRAGLLAELARLDMPSLFVHGAQDIRPSWPTRQLAALMPDARFVEIAEADHYLWRGNPAALRAAIMPFVAGIGAGDGH